MSDPSKVEKRVMEQMQQRQLNHEMRNQARKLTPAERREKKRKKLQEDTSRQVHVAIFRVADFSDPKHRFKVDVNIQQLNLTGTGGASYCTSAAHILCSVFVFDICCVLAWQLCCAPLRTPIW